MKLLTKYGANNVHFKVNGKVVPYRINECWAQSWSWSLGSQWASDL